MKYDPGDVVFGDDPFNDREAPRPWLVVSDETHPFYGEQYIAVTLTTKSWHDHTITLTDDNWEHVGCLERVRSFPGALPHLITTISTMIGIREHSRRRWLNRSPPK